MRYPENLPKDGTIGFVAPAFGCNKEPYKSAFENAKRKLAGCGYRLDLGPNCYEDKGVGISNTPEECARELMEYYQSPENNALISCGGGELMCEILEYMDFDALKKAAPKWFMGYSDNTNMTYLLATYCDTASIYGPNAPAFGMEPWHTSLEDAMGLLTGEKNAVRGYDKWERESEKSEENPLAPYHVTEKRVLKSFIGKKPVVWESHTEGTCHNTAARADVATADDISMAASCEIHFGGRLLGGCMDCLVNLLGTRFDKTHEFLGRYKEDGIIWFLEVCDLNVFAIRRAMWQMEQAGWFQYVKGFLIGRPLCFGQEMMGLTAYDAVLEAAGRKNVPVIMDVDLGHLPPMMPLIVGSRANVTVRGNDISIIMDNYG